MGFFGGFFRGRHGCFFFGRGGNDCGFILVLYYGESDEGIWVLPGAFH